MEDKNKNAHPFDLETVLKQEIIELFFFKQKHLGSISNKICYLQIASCRTNIKRESTFLSCG